MWTSLLPSEGSRWRRLHSGDPAYRRAAGLLQQSVWSPRSKTLLDAAVAAKVVRTRCLKPTTCYEQSQPYATELTAKSPHMRERCHRTCSSMGYATGANTRSKAPKPHGDYDQ